MNIRQLETILLKNGWVLVRTIDSSYQYRKANEKNSVILHDCGTPLVSASVLTHLEKITGLSFPG